MMRLKSSFYYFAVASWLLSTTAWATQETEIGESESLKIVVYNPELFCQEAEPVYRASSCQFSQTGVRSLACALPTAFETGTGWYDFRGGAGWYDFRGGAGWNNAEALKSRGMRWLTQKFQKQGFGEAEKAKKLVWVYLGRDKQDQNIKWSVTFSFLKPDTEQDTKRAKVWIQHTPSQQGGGALEGVVSHTAPNKSTTEGGAVWLHAQLDHLAYSQHDYVTTYGKDGQNTGSRGDRDKRDKEGCQFFNVILNHLQSLDEFWVYRSGNELDDEGFISLKAPLKLWSSNDDFTYFQEVGFKESAIRAPTTREKKSFPWQLETIWAWHSGPQRNIQFGEGVQEAEMGRTPTSRIVVYNPNLLHKAIQPFYDTCRDEYHSYPNDGLIKATQNITESITRGMRFEDASYMNKRLWNAGMRWFSQEFAGAGFHHPEKAKRLVCAYLERDEKTGNVQRYAYLSLNPYREDWFQYVPGVEGDESAEGVFSSTLRKETSQNANAPVWLNMPFEQMAWGDQKEDNTRFLKTILDHLETGKNTDPFYIYHYGSALHQETFVPVSQVRLWAYPEREPKKAEALEAVGFTKELVRTAYPRLEKNEKAHEGAQWGLCDVYVWKPNLLSVAQS